MGHRASLIVFWLAACACTPTFQAANGRTPDIRERWLPAYAFGVLGEPAIDVRDLCESGTATGVSVGANFGTVAVSVLTLGIYTPRKVWVACAPRGN